MELYEKVILGIQILIMIGITFAIVTADIIVTGTKEVDCYDRHSHKIEGLKCEKNVYDCNLIEIIFNQNDCRAKT